MEFWNTWVETRLTFSVNFTTNKDIEDFLKIPKAFWHGSDKYGHPCLVIKVKYHDTQRFTQD